MATSISERISPQLIFINKVRGGDHGTTYEGGVFMDDHASYTEIEAFNELVSIFEEGIDPNDPRRISRGLQLPENFLDANLSVIGERVNKNNEKTGKYVLLYDPLEDNFLHEEDDELLFKPSESRRDLTNVDEEEKEDPLPSRRNLLTAQRPPMTHSQSQKVLNYLASNRRLPPVIGIPESKDYDDDDDDDNQSVASIRLGGGGGGGGSISSLFIRAKGDAGKFIQPIISGLDTNFADKQFDEKVIFVNASGDVAISSTSIIFDAECKSRYVEKANGDTLYMPHQIFGGMKNYSVTSELIKKYVDMDPSRDYDDYDITANTTANTYRLDRLFCLSPDPQNPTFPDQNLWVVATLKDRNSNTDSRSKDYVLLYSPIPGHIPEYYKHRPSPSSRFPSFFSKRGGKSETKHRRRPSSSKNKTAKSTP